MSDQLSKRRRLMQGRGLAIWPSRLTQPRTSAAAGRGSPLRPASPTTQPSPTASPGSPQTLAPPETVTHELRQEWPLSLGQVRENLQKVNQKLVKLQGDSICMIRPEQRKQLMDKLQEWKPKNEETRKEFRVGLLSLLSSCFNLLESLQRFSDWKLDSLSAKLKLELPSDPCIDDDEDEDDPEIAQGMIQIENFGTWKEIFKDTVSTSKALLSEINYELENEGKNLGIWLERTQQKYLRAEKPILLAHSLRAIYIGYELSHVLVQFMVYLTGKEYKIQELKSKFVRIVMECPEQCKVAKKFLVVMHIAERVVSEMKLEGTLMEIEAEEDDQELDHLISLFVESVKDLDWVVCWKAVPEKSWNNLTRARMRLGIALGRCAYNMMGIKTRVNKNQNKKIEVWKAVKAIVDQVWHPSDFPEAKEDEAGPSNSKQKDI